MSGTIVRAGRFFTGGTPDFAVVGASQQRAYTADNPGGSGQVIWYRLGARVGRPTTDGIPAFRLAMMSTATGSGSRGANSRVPSAVLAYTAEATTTALFTGSNEGETRFLTISPVLGDRDEHYAFAATSRTAQLAIGMTQALNIPDAHNTWFYDRGLTAGTNIPDNGYTSTVNAGNEAIWAEGEANLNPNTPGAITISGGSNNRQPTMTAGFSDANETLNNGVAWDQIDGHEHEVLWGGVSRWKQVMSATGSEQTNRRSQRQIGVVVPFNTTITYRVRHRDRGGLWSGWRTITFSVASGATVDKPTTPAGRVTNLENPGNVQAIYRSSAGLNTNAVRFGLFSPAGTLMRQTPIIPATVAPNGLIDIPWSQLTLDRLTPGAQYEVRVMARDTGGNWSQWSIGSVINVNAMPSIPAFSSPADNRVAATVPEFIVRAIDVDAAPADVTVTVEVLNAIESAVLGTAVGVYRPSTSSVPEYAVDVSGIITSHGTYKLRGYSFDGYLYSGGGTTAAGASRSESRTFTYAAVPGVTVTAPVSPIGTSQPVIEWVSTNQTAWRVQLQDVNGALVYDTGVQAGGAQLHAIDGVQNWINGERWNRDETLTLTVMVQDASTLWGSSDPLPLTLVYDPTDPITIDGQAMALPGLRGTHYGQLQCGLSQYDESEFAYYTWTRVDITGPEGSEIPGTHVTLARVVTAGATTLFDFDMTSRQWYRYSVVQAVYRGVDIVESDPVSIDLMISFAGTLLHLPFDPMNNYLWLQYGAESYQPEASWHDGSYEVMTLNGKAPWDYTPPMNTTSWRGSFGLVPSREASAEEQLATLRRLWSYQRKGPDGRPHIMCWREGRGGEDARVYGRLISVSRGHTEGARYRVDVEFAERHHVLGISQGATS